jgi:hypothetical protein
LFSRAKLTVATASEGFHTATAKALGTGSHAAIHPDTCVPPGWSPM